ncbi:MAG: winged helix-turn-helix domain-containing protein [Candidatus Methylacidiphilales bacterium]|nr:crosslink repair DNA glycosylase YcaQ family protein [Candidatus Methylacidiphilales bacterium]
MKTDDVVPLSLTEARAIALRSQGLADVEAPFGLGKEGVLNALHHLGYVQVDTVHVVQRAHHHVLWSRVPDYELEMLHEVQSVDFTAFEYWNHAASILPMRDYRFSLPLMRKYHEQMHWCKESPEITASITRMLNLVRDKGPVTVSDIESAGSVRGWWEATRNKIERRAFHELWMRGDLMIRSRQGMKKVFDLTERVLPKGIDISIPDGDEAAEFHVRTSLKALGVARPQELHYMRDAKSASAHRTALRRLQEKGEVVEVNIEGMEKGTAFALREALELAAPLSRGAVRLLSPFDNFTIQRKRMSWLFGFEYTIEIYVPPAKRIYGYFVLPILWGDSIVGRMDVKAHRAERLLTVNNLVFEPGFRDFTDIKPAMIEALNAFAHFQQCDKWKIVQASPKSFRLSQKVGRRK